MTASVNANAKDNIFEIHYGRDVSTVQFEYSRNPEDGTDYQATDGALTFVPFVLDAENAENNGFFRASVQANRKCSASSASSFNHNVLSNEEYKNIAKDRPWSKKPGKLNFWIKGKLKINGYDIAGNVFFGQGSTIFSNNWWFGVGDQSHELHESGYGITIKDASGNLYCIYPTDSNVFKVAKGNCTEHEEEFTFFGHRFSNNVKTGMVFGTITTVVVGGMVATAAVLANQHANNNQTALITNEVYSNDTGNNRVMDEVATSDHSKLPLNTDATPSSSIPATEQPEITFEVRREGANERVTLHNPKGWTITSVVVNGLTIDGKPIEANNIQWQHQRNGVGIEYPLLGYVDINMFAPGMKLDADLHLRNTENRTTIKNVKLIYQPIHQEPPY